MAAASRALSALRLDTIPRLPPVIALSSRSNSNRTSVSHLHRQLYGRLYPVLLVKTDGSTIRLRYKEPKRILMLPVDSNTLPSPVMGGSPRLAFTHLGDCVYPSAPYNSP
ncbi:39S ribosomal protein L55, mitochondrial [Pezoporus wallicus]|uniref:39S ribosomal protein L55, mitochondrial n=1 Tax=Pezoporus wallicus TaxID=35540 RepID=UPI00254E42FE|nr:39S ribosomal protein L55, mitochondrial [Pezoporus wallicus]